MISQVALYARVSTPNQVEAQTIDQQLARLHNYVKEQDWHLRDEHIFRDDGRSGANLNRPGLDRLRDAARGGEFDRVVVTAPDRLARNYVQQMIVLEELERLGCQVDFLDRPMSNDPHDRLLLQIRGAVAEYERTLIADRMRRGRQLKYRAGTLLPWSRPPYGYRLNPDRPRDPAGLYIDQAEAAVIRQLYEWYTSEDEKVSLQELAQRLHRQGVPTPNGKKLWSLCTIHSILHQPAYTGQIYADRFRSQPPKVRRSATHPIGRSHDSTVEQPPEMWIPVTTVPAIITQEQFDLAQQKLRQNRSFAARNTKGEHYLLRRLVSCGRCLSSCYGRRLPGGHEYYVCAGKANPIHSRKQAKCPTRFSPVQQLDELVWADLCKVLTHPESINYALERAFGGQWLPQELLARREQLRQSQTRLQHQIDRLTEAYLNEIIPLAEYQRRRRDLEQKLEALVQQEKQLDGQADRHKELNGLTNSVEDFCQRMQSSLTNATFAQKRHLIELLIDRVIVDDGDIEIRYVIPTSPSSESIRFCHLRSDYFGSKNLIGSGNREPLQKIRENSVLQVPF
jgi:site-specific DNA recombinase